MKLLQGSLVTLSFVAAISAVSSTQNHNQVQTTQSPQAIDAVQALLPTQDTGSSPEPSSTPVVTATPVGIDEAGIKAAGTTVTSWRTTTATVYPTHCRSGAQHISLKAAFLILPALIMSALI